MENQVIDGFNMNIVIGKVKIMKNKFLSILIIIILGSFLLSISMFLIARILYNFENNMDLFNIHFLDYFNDGFIDPWIKFKVKGNIYVNIQYDIDSRFIKLITVSVDDKLEK